MFVCINGCVCVYAHVHAFEHECVCVFYQSRTASMTDPSWEARSWTIWSTHLLHLPSFTPLLPVHSTCNDYSVVKWRMKRKWDEKNIEHDFKIKQEQEQLQQQTNKRRKLKKERRLITQLQFSFRKSMMQNIHECKQDRKRWIEYLAV